jgi:hypothetical protein
MRHFLFRVQRVATGSLVLFGAITALSSVYAEDAMTVVPPSYNGNPLNLRYAFDKDSTDYGMTSFRANYIYESLDPSSDGIRFITNEFSLKSQGPTQDSARLYIGINPPNASKNSPGQAHFSLFGKLGGRIFTAGNCHTGADYGEGITCSLNGFHATSGHKYVLEVKVDRTDSQSTVVEGNVEDRDPASNVLFQTYQVGKFEVMLPDATLGGIFAWVEGDGSVPCDARPANVIDWGPIERNSSPTDLVPLSKISSAHCGALYGPSTTYPGYMSIQFGPIPAS